MRIQPGLLLWTLPALAALAHADEHKTPWAVLDHAHYVALGYDIGDGFLGAQELARAPADTLIDERRAIDAVRRDLEKWRKYVVTLRPEDAEILIAVRVGSRASLEVGVRRGGPMDARARQRPSFGGEVSSSEDMLEIFQSVDGRPGMLLWRGTEADGLAGSPPRLFKNFRDEMERQARKP